MTIPDGANKKTSGFMDSGGVHTTMHWTGLDYALEHTHTHDLKKSDKISGSSPKKTLVFVGEG